MAGEDAEIARHVKPGWRNRCAEADQQVVGLERDGVGAVFPDVFQREHQPTVISAAHRHAALRTTPWSELWKARAVVALGGDAVADSAGLYDEC